MSNIIYQLGSSSQHIGMELNRNDLKPVFHFARDAHQEQAEVVQYFWCLHLDEKEQIKTICCSQSPAVTNHTKTLRCSKRPHGEQFPISDVLGHS